MTSLPWMNKFARTEEIMEIKTYNLPSSNTSPIIVRNANKGKL